MWINGISDSMHTTENIIRASTVSVPEFKVSPVLTEALEKLKKYSSNEVNHRPAAEQFAVCTP